MSLDDTAENKDIPKKLREEDTDRHNLKEYCIIAENTKAFRSCWWLLIRRRSWYGCKRCQRWITCALAGAAGSLSGGGNKAGENPTKPGDPYPDKPGKQAT